MKRSLFYVLAGVLSAMVSCKETPTSASSSPPERAGANPSSPATAGSLPTVSPTSAPRSASVPDLYRVPVGPVLAVLPGEGVGPIRFGATLKTIERLMEAPCTEKTETDSTVLCRYQAHAVDYTLRDGVLTEIHVHGTEREFTPGKGLDVGNTYGVFNGGFVNGARFGMYPKFVRLGQPLRTETVKPGRFPTVEKHYYDGLVLEYDKLQNGNVVLGGAVLTKSNSAASTKSPPPRNPAAGSPTAQRPVPSQAKPPTTAKP